jgi:hypothetical protein
LEPLIMTKPTHAILALLAGVACGSAFAAGNLQQWEMTTKSMSGTTTMPDQKMIVCRKKEETSKPPMPANCKMSTTGSSSANGAFVMACSGEHPYTIKGEGRQTATTMEGTMDIIMEGSELKQSYSGKLIGSCDVEGATMVASPGAGSPQLFDRSSMMQQAGSPPPYAREGQRERAQAYAQAQGQAAEKATQPAEAPPATEEKPESTAEKAKKKLKSLLPF